LTRDEALIFLRRIKKVAEGTVKHAPVCISISDCKKLEKLCGIYNGEEGWDLMRPEFKRAYPINRNVFITLWNMAYRSVTGSVTEEGAENEGVQAVKRPKSAVEPEQSCHQSHADDADPQRSRGGVRRS
jgi:hypothetical protein